MKKNKNKKRYVKFGYMVHMEIDHQQHCWHFFSTVQLYIPHQPAW
jgi:hypothetical protein